MNIVPRKLYFDDFFDSFLSSRTEEMKCDIYEKDNAYNFVLDLPGFDKEEISIEADKGYLKIRASKSSEKDEEDKNYIRRERTYGSYERSFYLGDLDEDEISAKFENGTLNINVPKKKEIETKKTIEIE